MFEPNQEPIEVSPDTDDLDAFNDLLNGKATVKEEKPDELEPEKIDTPAEDEPEETPDDDAETPDEDDDSEDKTEEKPKKVNRFQERINELTAKAREAERALEALRAETAAKQEPKQAPAQVADTSGPDPLAKNPDGTDKYALGEFDPQYIRDLTRHEIQKEQTAIREQAERDRQASQLQEARNQIQEKWVEKLAVVTEKHDDFLDKTLQLESAFDGLDPQYSDYLVQTIKSLEHGPEVLYYFANNLDEAAKIVRKGPFDATLALGELNAMFKGNTKKETKVSNAPPPPQVNKGTKTRVAVTPDTDDLDAFSKLLFGKGK